MNYLGNHMKYNNLMQIQISYYTKEIYNKMYYKKNEFSLQIHNPNHIERQFFIEEKHFYFIF